MVEQTVTERARLQAEAESWRMVSSYMDEQGVVGDALLYIRERLNPALAARFGELGAEPTWDALYQFVVDVVATLEESLAALPQPKRASKAPSAVSTLQSTRWEASLLRSCTFFCDNIDTLSTFYSEEAKRAGAPESVVRLAALLSTPGTIERCRVQGDRFVAVMLPLFEWVVSCCDSAIHNSPMLAVHARRANIIDLLSRDALVDDFMSDCCNLMIQKSAVLDRNEHFAGPKFFEQVALLNPGTAALHKGALSLSEFRARIIPDAEWAAYVREAQINCRSKREERLSTKQFWEKEHDAFPKLTECARFFLSLPVVVTSCDAMFSIEKAQFGASQSTVDPKTHAKRLQWRTNREQLACLLREAGVEVQAQHARSSSSSKQRESVEHVE